MPSAPVTVAADSAIFVSGKPVRLYAAAVDSGATPAVINFRNGTSAGDPALFNFTATASKKLMVPDIPPCGLLFPAGLFVDVDANTNGVTVWAELVANF